MEPPVGRVVVLRGAPGAQHEFRHCCLRPVIGHVAHDGEPRAAVRAVDERIPEAPVAGVGQLTQAVRTGRGICRHQRPALAARLARCDHEFSRARDPQAFLVSYPLDPGQRGGLLPEQPSGTRRPASALPSTSANTPSASLPSKTAEAQARRQPVNERPEGDRPERRPRPGWRSGRCWPPAQCAAFPLGGVPGAEAGESGW